MTNDRRHVRTLLSLHLDGELDPQRQEELDRLLDASESMQAELAMWKRFREVLAIDVLAIDDEEPVTGNVANAVMATIGAHNREIASIIPFAKRLAAAAAILLMTMATTFVALPNDASTTTPGRTELGDTELGVAPERDLSRSLFHPTSIALTGEPVGEADSNRNRDDESESGK